MTTPHHGAGTRITIDGTTLSIALVMLLVLATVMLSLFVLGS